MPARHQGADRDRAGAGGGHWPALAELAGAGLSGTPQAARSWVLRSEYSACFQIPLTTVRWMSCQEPCLEPQLLTVVPEAENRGWGWAGSGRGPPAASSRPASWLAMEGEGCRVCVHFIGCRRRRKPRAWDAEDGSRSGLRFRTSYLRDACARAAGGDPSRKLGSRGSGLPRGFRALISRRQ